MNDWALLGLQKSSNTTCAHVPAKKKYEMNCDDCDDMIWIDVVCFNFMINFAWDGEMFSMCYYA